MNNQANSRSAPSSPKPGLEVNMPSNEELQGHGLLDRPNLVQDKRARLHPQIFSCGPVKSPPIETVAVDDDKSPLGPLRVNRHIVRHLLDNGGIGHYGSRIDDTKQRKIPKIDTEDYKHWEFLHPDGVVETTRKYYIEVNEIRQYEEYLAKELENIKKLPGALSRSLQINDSLLADREQSIIAYKKLWEEMKKIEALLTSLRQLPFKIRKTERDLSQEKVRSETLDKECQAQQSCNRMLSTEIERRQAQITKLEKQIAAHADLETEYRHNLQQTLQLQSLYAQREQDFRLLEEYCVALQKEICATATNLEIALGIQNQLPFDLMLHWAHESESEAQAPTSPESGQGPAAARLALLGFSEEEPGLESVAVSQPYPREVSPGSNAPILELSAGLSNLPRSTSLQQKHENSSKTNLVPQSTGMSTDSEMMTSRVFEQTDNRSVVPSESLSHDLSNNTSLCLSPWSAGNDGLYNELQPHDHVTSDFEELINLADIGQEDDISVKFDSGYESGAENPIRLHFPLSPVSPFSVLAQDSSSDTHPIHGQRAEVEAGLGPLTDAGNFRILHFPPSPQKEANTARSETSPNTWSEPISISHNSKLTSPGSLPPAQEETSRQSDLRDRKSDGALELPSLYNPDQQHIVTTSSHGDVKTQASRDIPQGKDSVKDQHTVSETESDQVTNLHKQVVSSERRLSQPADVSGVVKGFLEFLPATTYKPNEELLPALTYDPSEGYPPRLSPATGQSPRRTLSRIKQPQPDAHRISPRPVPLPISKLDNESPPRQHVSTILRTGTDADPSARINRALGSVDDGSVSEHQSKFQEKVVGQEIGKDSNNTQAALVMSKLVRGEPLSQTDLVAQLRSIQHKLSSDKPENAVKGIMSLKNGLQNMFNELEITESSNRIGDQCKIPHESMPSKGALSTSLSIHNPIDNPGRQGITEQQVTADRELPPTQDSMTVRVPQLEPSIYSSSLGISTGDPEREHHSKEGQERTGNRKSRPLHSGDKSVLTETNSYILVGKQSSASTSHSTTLVSNGSRACGCPEEVNTSSEHLSSKSMLPNVEDRNSTFNQNVCCEGQLRQTGRICFLGISEQQVEPFRNSSESHNPPNQSLESLGAPEDRNQNTKPGRVRGSSSFILKTKNLSQVADQELHEWGNRHIFCSGYHAEEVQPNPPGDSNDLLRSGGRAVSQFPGMFSPPDSIWSSNDQKCSNQSEMRSLDLSGSKSSPLFDRDCTDVPASIMGSKESLSKIQDIRPVDDILSPDQLRRRLTDFNTAPTSPGTPVDSGHTEPHIKNSLVTRDTTLKDLFCWLLTIREHMIAAFWHTVRFITHSIVSSLRRLLSTPIVDMPWISIQLCFTAITFIIAAPARLLIQLADAWSSPRFHLIAACICIICTYLVSLMGQNWYTANTSNMREKIMAWREDWWDWRILQHLRWHLQMAIERRHLHGESVILT